MMGFSTRPCRGLRLPTYNINVCDMSSRRSALAESDMMGFSTRPCRGLRPPTYNINV
jgi:hypothetical protein